MSTHEERRDGEQAGGGYGAADEDVTATTPEQEQPERPEQTPNDPGSRGPVRSVDEASQTESGPGRGAD